MNKSSDSRAALLARLAALPESELAVLADLAPATSPPCPAPVVGEATAAQIAAWSALYGVGRRQLFRYIEIGLAHGYPCPLDRPVEFAGKWWARPRMKQRVPENILRAAQQAAAQAGLASANHPPPAAADPAATSTPPPAAAAVTDGFDLKADFGEGGEVAIARQLVARFAAKVQQAMDANKVEEVQTWNRHLREAIETFRKAKNDDRAAQEGSGLVLSRAEVELQVFQILKTLAAMRAAMSKRLTADLRTRFPDLPEEVFTALAECTETHRAKEDEIFRDLNVLQKPDDVFRLAA